MYEYDAKEHELFRSDRAGERAKQKEEKRDEKKERPSLKERLAEKKNDVMKMDADRKQPTADKKKEAENLATSYIKHRKAATLGCFSAIMFDMKGGKTYN